MTERGLRNPLTRPTSHLAAPPTPFLSGFMGVTSALVRFRERVCILLSAPRPSMHSRSLFSSPLPRQVFANLGAAYGTAKAGVGIASMGIMHPAEVGVPRFSAHYGSAPRALRSLTVTPHPTPPRRS